MSDRATARRVASVISAVLCLLAGCCASVKHARPPEPPPAATEAAPAAVAELPAAAEPRVAPATVVAPEPRATPVPPVPATPPAAVAPPRQAPAQQPAAKATGGPAQPRPATPAAAVKAPAAVAALPAPTAQAPRAVAPVAPKPAAATLNLKSLETRLRETRAIGVFTKVSLKNQVDDLLVKFRAYHKRQATTSLAELRRSYNMLMLKVLSLLQDSDPSLARDIVASREAIWGILSDPTKFTESNLMAGASP